MNKPNAAPAVPSSFTQYIRSMGPGLVVALTWLGAGDLVDSAVAGGHYGYSLMWAIAIALFVRFVFVSIIAKYHLCNQHGESVMAGLRRVHRQLPMLIGAIALFFGHFYNSYMIKGVGETTTKLVGVLAPWQWSVFWVLVTAALLWRGTFRHIEIVFYVFLMMLSVSLIGVAVWSGPNPLAALQGVFLFSLPEQKGPFAALLVVTSLIGAVGGSIANLLYPYFMDQKGWTGARFRPLQQYDLAFGTFVIVALNLAVWTIGAEILHPRGITITNLDDLANLLTVVLGKLGGPIFYLGVFAALYSSVIGIAAGYGLLCADVVNVHRSGNAVHVAGPDVARSKTYRIVAAWCLFSPLVWSLPGMPGFITLTVLANAASVVVLPLLCGSLWYITARTAFIGPAYRNRWWENGLMGGLFLLSLWGAYQSIAAIAAALSSA
jgi:Mn2+/Fe2+ NRAMP family transporter